VIDDRCGLYNTKATKEAASVGE